MGGIVALAYFSVELTLWMLGTLPVMILAAVVFGRFIRKLSKQTQDEVAASNVVVQDVLTAIVSVKSYANEWLERRKYGTHASEIKRLALRGALWRGTFASFIILFIFGAITLVIFKGAELMQQGELASEHFFTFLLMTGLVAGSIGGMAAQFSALQRGLGAIESVMDIVEQETYYGSSGDFVMDSDYSMSQSDDAMKLIPILWSTNYKSFKNLGFGTADEEFSYEKSRHIITVEERYQFFNDISDIFGNISSWPLRNRFNILKENLNKLIETDLLTKCLHKTSVSMPGDSNKNFQYLRGFIHYFSYRSYIGNYFQKYEPLVRLFEKFFQEDSENSTESYAKFLEDINNQEIIPSGYQNLLSMTMSVAEYSDVEDIVVFLDEPEISLHISWQIKLVPFLYGLLDTKDYPPPFSTFLLRNSNKFLIIATHSPEIVSGLLENTVDFSSNIDL